LSKAEEKMTTSHNEPNERKILLKGTGASRGTASGPVKIIRHIQDLPQMQSGDVLVTPMTNPDMVVAMTKAEAIITDIGGITSHAAIISRELGIPCVVGTQVATKVLKNGAMVEVDGTNGIVYKSLKHTSSTPPKNEYTLFGRQVTSVQLTMERDHPIWPDNWDYEWPEVDMNTMYEWIPYRPDIYGEPIANYLFSAIEKVPYALGFNIGPLYIRYHTCNLTLRLDKAQATLAMLSDKLISRDDIFFKEWKHKLFAAYQRLDKLTQELVAQQAHFREQNSDRLINLFKKWWRAHDDRFSLSFLIVSMGNMIWSEIRRILTEIFTDESTINEYLTRLALPTSKTTSITFLDECIDLVTSSNRVKSLILSNLDPTNSLEILNELPEGRQWLEDLEQFIQKWGWMRDRLLYHPPIDTNLRMITFLRRHAPSEVKKSPLENNRAEFENGVEQIRNHMTIEQFNDFMSFLKIGRFFQLERDRHHIRHMRQTYPIRALFLEFGRRLTEEHLLNDEKDIFFLFIQEVFDLLSPKASRTKKLEISSKIPNRMNAFAHTSGLTLHYHPGHDPTQVPTRDGEYY
jgi:phosphohistidine swiveling domain-containing protein